MKKVAIIAISILFFLVLIALVLLKIFSPGLPKSASNDRDPFKSLPTEQASLDTSTPQSTVKSCLEWYLKASVQGSDSSALSTRPEAIQCFTKDYIDSWQMILDDAQVDPVFLSGKVNSNWFGGISIVQKSVIQRTVTEQVTLGKSGSSDTRILTVQVKEGLDQHWQIDSVSESQ